MEQLQDNSLTIHKCIWDITTYILTKPDVSIDIYYNSANIFGVQVIDNKFKDTNIINAFEYTSYKDQCKYIEQIVDVIDKIGEYIQLQISIDNMPVDTQSILTSWSKTDNLKISIINNTLLPYYENYSSVMLFYNFMFDMETMNQALSNHHWLKALEETKDSDCIYDWPKDIDDIKDCLEPLNPCGISITIELIESNDAYPCDTSEEDLTDNNDDIDNEDKCIDDEKYITINLFINKNTGMIEVSITEHVPVIWYAPTMDITYNDKKVLEGAYSLTASPSASTVIENDLIQAKTFNDCTKIVYKLKDLIDILTDVAYRN
jgi:hypothetical protein